MPLFEYKCPTCGNGFEELVKKYDDEVFCPECGSLCQKNYNGTMFSGTGQTVKKCSGDCKNCKGCG